MRISSLSLLAFGAFTEQTLTFGPPGSVDFVYGPNEAGKSTSLRAVVALLYGVPMQTKDAYLHDQTELRIGATVTRRDGSFIDVVRRKGKKDTLLDPSGHPIDDALLSSLLGGTTREVFENAYGLDQVRLRSGGQTLLEGKGELGESLFGASLGSTSLHALLKKTREQARELFSPGAKNPPLNAHLRAYEEARKKIATDCTRFEAYDLQVAGIERGRVERDECVAAKTKLVGERQQLEQLRVLVPTREKLLARIRDLQAELLQAKAKRDAIVVEGGLLEASDAIVHVQERLSEQRRAQIDLPPMRAEIARLTALAVETLTALGRPGGLADARGILPTLATEAEIEKLVGEAALLAREEARIEDALRRAHAGIGVARVKADTKALRAALEMANEAGDVDGAAREIEDRLEGFAHEPSSTDLPVPPLDVVASFERDFTSVEQVRSVARARQREIEVETARCDEALSTLRAEGAPPTEAELADAREERDGRWGAIPSASPKLRAAALLSFERSMRHADVISDRLRREAARAATQAQLVASREALRTRAEVAARESADCDAALQALTARWRALWKPTGVEPLGPTEMRSWLVRHAERVAATEKQTEARRHLERLRARATDVTARLAGALGDLGVALGHGKSVGEARALAKATLADVDAAERERERGEHTIAQLEAEALAVQKRRERWHAAWERTASGMGLTEGASVEQVGAVAVALRGLRRTIHELDDTSRRVAGLEQASLGLERLVSELVVAHAPDLTDLSPVEAASRLVRRAGEAKDALAERRRFEDAAQKCEDLLERTEREHRETGLAIAGAAEGLDAATVSRAGDRLGEIEAAVEELESRIERANRELGRNEAALPEMESRSLAAAAATEAEQELSVVRELADRYAMLRIAETVLSLEIERFREEHQGPVLKRASELFRRLTLDGYEGLREGFGDDDRPVLRAARAKGDVSIESLSDGARDQLYLALRLASWERLAKTNEPLPVVLDDVLIQFDDDRARAALVAFGELATAMQVVFFTHHARLVELAREALGERAHLLSLGS